MYRTGKRFVLRLTSTPQGSRAHNTEADIVVPVVRVVVVVPVNGTSVRSRIVPTPAAYYTVSARGFFLQPLPLSIYIVLSGQKLQPSKNQIFFSASGGTDSCLIQQTKIRLNSDEGLALSARPLMRAALRFSTFGLQNSRAHNTEADTAAPEVRVVVAPANGTRVRSRIAPTPAA